MSEIVAGVLQKQLSGNAAGMEKQLQQSPNGGRSFENVLQQNSGQTAPSMETQSSSQINKISDPKLDAMRVDLMQRYQNLPEGVPKVTAIFPEFLDTKTQMSTFRNILNQAIGSSGNNPPPNDIVGRFSQTEDEWFKLENVMRSDKELTQGEMLGLQARLYQVSQHIDVLSKVIDQMSSGVKTILNTNV
ncbi:MAG: hypothetical protein ACR2HG_00770 [Pyrinomonadaceae bacterium]